MKILGAGLPRRASRPVVNTHPALLPSFPGVHAVRDALEYGVKVTGCTVHLVDAGVDTGPVIAQRAVEVRRRTTTRPRCTNASRSSSARCSSTSSAAHGPRRGRTVTGQEGHDPVSETASDPARADQRLRQDRARGARARAARRRRRDRVHRLDGAADRRRRRAGHRGRGPHRVPRVPRRPGQDAAPARARGHPRRPPQLEDHRKQLDELGVAAFELRRGQPLPVRRRPSRPAPHRRRVRRADRHRRAVDGARRGEEPRERRGRQSPGALRRRARGGRAGGLRPRDRAAASPARRSRTPPPTTSPSRRGSRRRYAPADAEPFPPFAGATWQRADVLRYGENPHQAAALYVDSTRARPRAGRAAARQGDVLQQLRRRRRRLGARRTTTRARASRSSSTPTRAASRSAPTSPRRTARRTPCDPVLGVRRRHRHQRARSRVAMAEQVAEIFTEVVRRSVATSRRRGRGARPQAVDPAAASRPAPHADRASSAARSAAALLLQTADAVDAAGDDPSTWTLATGDAVDAATLADLAFAWRACRSVKSNAILLASDGATVGVGMGQVNRVDSARLAVSRAERPRPRLGRGVRRVLPVRRRPAGARSTPACAPSSSRAARCATKRSSTAAKAAGVTMYLTGTRHFFH